jgi:hypothetical protein
MAITRHRTLHISEENSSELARAQILPTTAFFELSAPARLYRPMCLRILLEQKFQKNEWGVR